MAITGYEFNAIRKARRALPSGRGGGRLARSSGPDTVPPASERPHHAPHHCSAALSLSLYRRRAAARARTSRRHTQRARRRACRRGSSTTTITATPSPAPASSVPRLHPAATPAAHRRPLPAAPRFACCPSAPHATAAFGNTGNRRHDAESSAKWLAGPSLFMTACRAYTWQDDQGPRAQVRVGV